MSVPSVHRANPELAAWVGASIVVAGLSLTGSLPRSTAIEFPARGFPAAQDLTGAVSGLLPEAPDQSPAFLRPGCLVLRAPDPRDLAAVLRAAHSAYPDASIAVHRAGEGARAMRVIAICAR